MIPLYLRQPNKGLKMGKKFWPTFRRWGRNTGSHELQGGPLVQMKLGMHKTVPKIMTPVPIFTQNLPPFKRN